MQNYGNPTSRNTARAANAGPVGSNQSQGKGEIPGKISVPFPQNADKPTAGGASKPKAPAGFNGGLIPGKI